MTSSDSQLKHTPLNALHKELGGKMVPFAGYEMPVQYPQGIIKEHTHTRAHASLFDVSHMGQLRLDGAGRAAALESLVPADVAGLAENAIRYSYFTNETGGILDDLMITNGGECCYLVVNAACKEADTRHLRSGLDGKAELTELTDLALLALQGPEAAAAFARIAPGVETMKFMSMAEVDVEGVACRVSRSGYSGEDGYEISLPAAHCETLARRLLAEPEVEAAGLGARDSLRLEAGLCLYGHDIDETTTPVEAVLAWAIQKRRRVEGGFPGAAVIQKQLAEGAGRRRVGILPQGRAPVREGAELVDPEGRVVGRVTSGGYGPSLGAPVAMGYVESGFSAEGSLLDALVRGRPQPCKVARMPFVKPGYYRG